MQVSRSTTIEVFLSSAEVIDALKAFYPHDINIQALPRNPSAKGVFVDASVPKGTCGLHIVYTKDTSVPAPAPIEHDPA